MSDKSRELLEIADRLEELVNQVEKGDIEKRLEPLEQSARDIGRAWSGSWLGYHANIYWNDLEEPPAGNHFSREWGFINYDRPGRRGSRHWEEFEPDKIKQVIRDSAGNPNLDDIEQYAAELKKQFENEKAEISSLLTTALGESPDTFLESLNEHLGNVRPYSAPELIDAWTPSGEIMTRDTLALGQGYRVPPHLSILSDIGALRNPPEACLAIAGIARKAGSHLARQKDQEKRESRVGTNVFIGHGGSEQWRVLKDFIQDRLALPWDEFNRVPVAGVTNIARLSEMLDAAAIAFLVLTAEDEQADGKKHARMNVVHEAGLFQGRLGFTRAIILLEDGCEEFSNIEGLGQIRFPEGKIEASFEEIRQVLEREGLIE